MPSEIAWVISVYWLELDLVVKKKMFPNDPFYKAVLIKESGKKSTVTNIFDDDDYDSDQ